MSDHEQRSKDDLAVVKLGFISVIVILYVLGHDKNHKQSWNLVAANFEGTESSLNRFGSESATAPLDFFLNTGSLFVDLEIPFQWLS